MLTLGDFFNIFMELPNFQENTTQNVNFQQLPMKLKEKKNLFTYMTYAQANSIYFPSLCVLLLKKHSVFLFTN